MDKIDDPAYWLKEIEAGLAAPIGDARGSSDGWVAWPPEKSNTPAACRGISGSGEYPHIIDTCMEKLPTPIRWM